MARREGFHWRRGGWRPTDRQREVLALLAEGASNAEIAVRLGISVDGAKWHVGELLAETGCEDRQALASWWQEEGQQRRQPLGLWFAIPSWRPVFLAPIAVLITAVLVYLLALSAGTRSGGEEQPTGADVGDALTPAAQVEDPGRPATCEPPEQLDLRIVEPEELAGQGLVSAGPLLDSKYCPIYVANRSDRSFVWVGGNASIDLTKPPPGWRIGGSSDIGVSLAQGAGDPLLEVVAVGLRKPLSEAGMATNDDKAEAITLRTDGEGGYLMLLLQQFGNFRRVALASNGELFLDPQLPPADAVVNRVTGEEIDVAEARRLARLPAGVEQGQPQAITKCSDEICHVQYSSVPAGMGAPIDGRIVCPEPGAAPGLRWEFDLKGEDLTLHFRTIDPNRPPAEWVCESGDVAAGDPLPVSNIVFIRAMQPDGSPTSILSSYEGTLYTGDIDLRLPCPCGWDF